jgi:hypothetical protein
VIMKKQKQEEDNIQEEVKSFSRSSGSERLQMQWNI